MELEACYKDALQKAMAASADSALVSSCDVDVLGDDTLVQLLDIINLVAWIVLSVLVFESLLKLLASDCPRMPQPTTAVESIADVVGLSATVVR